MGSIFSALSKLMPSITGRFVSPVPAVVLILLLMSERGKRSGLGYLLGWFLITLGVGIALLVSGAGIEKSHHQLFMKGRVYLHLGFGVMFLVLAGINAKKIWRHEKGTIIDTPKWLERIERLGFWGGLLLGIFMGSLGSPKNAAMSLQALIRILATNLSMYGRILVYAIFDVASSLIMIAIFLLYVVFREQSRQFLEQLKDWLLRYDNIMLLVLFIGLGLYFTGKGVMSLMGQ